MADPSVTCGTCKGTGRIGNLVCWACNGLGTLATRGEGWLHGESEQAYEPLPTGEMPLGHDAASDRLYAAGGSIYAAFDSLACGMDHDEAVRYLVGAPAFVSLPESVRGKVAGIVLGFALTAVESDRKVRRMSRWYPFR